MLHRNIRSVRAVTFLDPKTFEEEYGYVHDRNAKKVSNVMGCELRRQLRVPGAGECCDSMAGFRRVPPSLFSFFFFSPSFSNYCIQRATGGFGIGVCGRVRRWKFEDGGSVARSLACLTTSTPGPNPGDATKLQLFCSERWLNLIRYFHWQCAVVIAATGGASKHGLGKLPYRQR